MIKKIEIKNRVTQKSVTFDYEGVYVLDRVVWGTPEIVQSNYSVPKQIGKTKEGVVVGVREVEIYGYVIADVSGISYLGMKWDEYLSYQEKNIEENKEVLNRMFSIYQDVEIISGGYRLFGVPSSPVKYSSEYSENNEVGCYFQISILCNDPMFYKDEISIDLLPIENRFHFPLFYPEWDHVVFGVISERSVAKADNFGDVPVGCIVTMTAHGGIVHDPKLLNVSTGKFIGFSGVTLYSGDSIIINTTKTKESVIKRTASGVRSLVGNLLDGSEFLQIEVGTEYYFYDMDGSEQNLATTILYSEQFFNIGEM